MAQNMTVTVVDDLTGEDGAETIRFGLDGAQYEIDLAPGNAKRLREAMEPFAAVARRATATAGRPGRARDRKRPQQIRAWAKKEGIDLSVRGRIPADVAAQFDAALRQAEAVA